MITLSSFFSDSSVYADEHVYKFGVVPQFEIRQLYRIWQPVLNYLEKETGYKFQLNGSQTIPDFENELIQGMFDIAYMNPYHLILSNKEQGYIPLIKDEANKLYGVLVVKKDSNISEVSQLDGKTIVFPAPNALGASLQMRQELTDIFHLKIIPRYVRSHDSVYLNVLFNTAIAGGGGVQKTLYQQPYEYREALHVIHKTKPVASHPVAIHPRLPVEVRNAIKSALLKLGQSKQGAALLAKIPIKHIGEAVMADYLFLKQMGLERFYVKPY